jgi:microcystin-dependent protein
MSFYVSNTDINYTISQVLYLLTNYLDSFDVGDYKFSNSIVDQGSWLICDGRSLLRSEYSELFSAISTNYGSVDEDHFNLPDFSGKVFGQINVEHNIGDSVGAENITLTTNQIPSHTHTGTTDSSGIHNHAITDSGHVHIGTTNSSGIHDHSITDSGHTHTGTTSSNGIHSHTSNAVGGQGNYGLALADGNNTVESTDASSGELNVWTTPGSLTINNNGDHTHTFTSNNSTTGVTINNNGSHTHTFTSDNSSTGITINNNGTHTHTFTSNSTGGGLSHSNMQPTLFGGNVFILTKKLNDIEIKV